MKFVRRLFGLVLAVVAPLATVALWLVLCVPLVLMEGIDGERTDRAFDRSFRPMEYALSLLR